MDYSTSIVLDVRREKGNGVYPVKLRVYSTELKKAKLYSFRKRKEGKKEKGIAKIDFSKSEFQSIWETKKPRKEYQEIRYELEAAKNRADEICKEIRPFSFIQFEKKYLRSSGEGSNIVYLYNQTIADLKAVNSFGTASNYQMSLNSILDFIKHTKGNNPSVISFSEITPDWLEKYEYYMTSNLKRSPTTVSMYLRALRTIFNNAIEEGTVLPEFYPFRRKRERNKYVIPSVSNVKKALNSEELKKLFKAKPGTPEQAKARDFWFFSYACNGMNIKDIALLKYKDVQGDQLTFYRAKTIKTTKADMRPVTVYLNDYSKSIIKKYGNKNKNKSEYIFPIISDNESAIANHNKIKNFTKFINQNLKKLAVNSGITGDVSTYWARHSFATNAIRNGASMEFVGEAFDHRNPDTTKRYFAGFTDDVKKEFQQKIMSF